MQTDAALLANNSQHCDNIVGCCTLCPFAHPVACCCTSLRVFESCCAKFETGQTFNYVQTEATTPNIVACCCVRVAVVSKRMQKLPPACYNMQQGVQTDGTCNIQQCWDLLANNVTLFARGFKMVKNYSQRKSMILDVVIFSNFVQ